MSWSRECSPTGGCRGDLGAAGMMHPIPPMPPFGSRKGGWGGDGGASNRPAGTAVRHERIHPGVKSSRPCRPDRFLGPAGAFAFGRCPEPISVPEVPARPAPASAATGQRHSEFDPRRPRVDWGWGPERLTRPRHRSCEPRGVPRGRCPRHVNLSARGGSGGASPDRPPVVDSPPPPGLPLARKRPVKLSITQKFRCQVPAFRVNLLRWSAVHQPCASSATPAWMSGSSGSWTGARFPTDG